MFLQICIISKPGLPLLTSALTQNKRKMKTIKIHFIRCLINRKISLGIIKKLNNCQTTLYWYSQNDLFVHQIFICVSWFLSHEEFWGGMDKWRKCFLLILGEDFSVFLIYQWKKRIASVFSLGELTVRFFAAQVINIVAGCITKEFKEEETSVREWSCRNRWSCKKWEISRISCLQKLKMYNLHLTVQRYITAPLIVDIMDCF